MLEQLPHKMQQEIRILNRSIHGQESMTEEAKDQCVKMLIYHISDEVLTLLLAEDTKKFERFITSR